jgi:hypothetical protein
MKTLAGFGSGGSGVVAQTRAMAREAGVRLPRTGPGSRGGRGRTRRRRRG